MSDTPGTTEKLPPWQPAITAPTDGREFEYIIKGSGRIHTGSLASDCGGEIKRDPDMLAWREARPRIKWGPR